jgi:hypothetical protein
VVPITGQAKADLNTVVAELNILSGLVEQTLPPDSGVRLRLNTATQAVLRLLPLFLE